MSTWEEAYRKGQDEAKPVAKLLLEKLHSLNDQERSAFMEGLRHGVGEMFCWYCGAQKHSPVCYCRYDD